MFKKITYNPDHAIKAGMLVVGVTIGLIISFISGRVIYLLLLPIISQYHLVFFGIQTFLYPNEIKSLQRLVTSANLTDKADRYTMTWYRASAILTLQMLSDHYILIINANGINNTTNIDKLANEVGSAFHHSAFLTKVGNGYAAYRIDLTNHYQEVRDSDF